MSYCGSCLTVPNLRSQPFTNQEFAWKMVASTGVPRGSSVDKTPTDASIVNQ